LPNYLIIKYSILFQRWFQNRRAKNRRNRNNTPPVITEAPRNEASDAAAISVKEWKQDFIITPKSTTTAPPPKNIVSSFTMESILQPSPPSRPSSCNSERSSESSQIGTNAPVSGVNSYYEYYPFYNPAYMYHYYPIVPAHSRGMISPKTRAPNSGPPEQPLDLSCGVKKRECLDKDNVEPVPKRRKIEANYVESDIAMDSAIKSEIPPAIKYGPLTHISRRDSICYSKIRTMCPTPYYSSFAYNYGECRDMLRKDLFAPACLPMPSASSLYDRQYGY